VDGGVVITKEVKIEILFAPPILTKLYDHGIFKADHIFLKKSREVWQFGEIPAEKNV
jgi:hypothetical protein